MGMGPLHKVPGREDERRSSGDGLADGCTALSTTELYSYDAQGYGNVTSFFCFPQLHHSAQKAVGDEQSKYPAAGLKSELFSPGSVLGSARLKGSNITSRGDR